MARVIWKGAISFGLVHVPVALYPASQETHVDFDWLDQRSMDPVGYQRINKRTGKPVAKDHIVKGVKLDDGQYVVLSDEEIRAAFPRSTQTIAIEAFVKNSEVDFVLLERPYYLEPLGKAQRVYALLREAMHDAGVLGVARLVMHSKEHLALLIPSGSALMMDTIRWPGDIRGVEDLQIPPAGKNANKLTAGELKMAAQLIESMTVAWQGDAYVSSFDQAIHQLVSAKAQAGQAYEVTAVEEPAQTAGLSTSVVDLTQLLARSLEKRGHLDRPGPAASKTRSRTPAAKKPAARAAAKRKRP